MSCFAKVSGSFSSGIHSLRLDSLVQWLLRLRRPLWLKVYTLKDVGSALISVGRAIGIIEATATTTLGSGVAATAGL